MPFFFFWICTNHAYCNNPLPLWNSLPDMCPVLCTVCANIVFLDSRSIINWKILKRHINLLSFWKFVCTQIKEEGWFCNLSRLLITNYNKSIRCQLNFDCRPEGMLFTGWLLLYLQSMIISNRVGPTGQASTHKEIFCYKLYQCSTNPKSQGVDGWMVHIICGYDVTLFFFFFECNVPNFRRS